MLRKTYAAYNAAMKASNPREAIRAAFEPVADPEIEWVNESTVVAEQMVHHGLDGVMEFFDAILDAFEEVRQVPERFIDCGDQVLVFVHSEARALTAGLAIDEQWAHLITVRNGKIARVEQFRNRDQALEAAGLSE